MNIWLAPLHGITTFIFRNCLCRHFAGIDFFMSPFLPVQEKAKLNVQHWRDIWPQNNRLLPMIPQLMGNIPAHFTDTMTELHDTYGYDHFNWNLGCPVAQVTRHQRGCGLMPFPDRVEAVVQAAMSLPGLYFSVKMRLGMHHLAEGMEIVERLRNYPLDFVVIHPRLGDQIYSGTPDLEGFATLADRLKVPIVYSGDIFSIEDFMALQTRFPFVHDWMLGRGLLRNPFLAEEIKYLDCGNKIQRFRSYYNDLIEQLLPVRKEYGVLANLKELWHYYVSLIHLTPTELQQLLRVNSLSEFVTISNNYILDAARWQHR